MHSAVQLHWSDMLSRTRVYLHNFGCDNTVYVVYPFVYTQTRQRSSLDQQSWTLTEELVSVLFNPRP
jgi:hypothetical protein